MEEAEPGTSTSTHLFHEKAEMSDVQGHVHHRAGPVLHRDAYRTRKGWTTRQPRGFRRVPSLQRSGASYGIHPSNLQDEADEGAPCGHACSKGDVFGTKDVSRPVVPPCGPTLTAGRGAAAAADRSEARGS